MLDYQQLVNKYTEFASSLMETLKPHDVTEIAPGMISFRESYMLEFAKKKSKIPVECAKFYDSEILPFAKPDVDIIKLQKEIYQISAGLMKLFEDTYLKSKTF